MAKINVEKLRKRLELTQTAFAALLGVNQSTIARIEAGIRPPSKPVLKLLEQIASEQ
jgi:DNA-binding transcriptional regulator YiaG